MSRLGGFSLGRAGVISRELMAFNTTEIILKNNSLRLALVGMLALWAGAAVAQDFKAGDLTLHQPWIRAVPAGAGAAGGYVIITNSGSSDDRLLSFESAIAGHTEVHEMAMNSGVMTMRELPGGLPVPAGRTVELKPGGYHLMFMALKDRPQAGQEVKGRLVFEKAGAVDVTFTVAPLGAKAPMTPDAHGMHHTKPAQ